MATAGWLAMASPALAILVLLRFIGPRARHPRVRGMLQNVVLAIAVVGTIVTIAKKVDAVAVSAAGAAPSLGSSLLH